LLINRIIKNFHVIHCIDVSHASSKYRLAIRSQVNKSNENHYPSNDTVEIFDDERTILAQAKLEYHHGAYEL
jgi:hypothetical protein